jgi:NADH-ubiquinone oxidoreductase chain 2
MPKISILILLLNLQIGISISLYQFIFIANQLLNLDTVLNSFNINFNNILFNNLLFDINTYNIITNLFLLSSLLSLIIGTIVGLSQTRIKRLFAFSTISHVGFLLLGLAINNEQSIESFIFYIIQYSLINFNIFLIILAIGYSLVKYKTLASLHHKQVSLIQSNVNLDVELISNFKGLFFKNPMLSLSFALSLFSLAGIPPLIGFFAKQQILYAATANAYFFISIVAILTSVISGFYYLRIIKLLQSENNVEINDITINSPKLELVELTQNFWSLKFNNLFKSFLNLYSDSFLLSNVHAFFIGTLTLFNVLFIFNPSLLLNSVQILTLTIFT